MAIIKIKNQAIDLDAAEIPNIDASKITSGSIASARLGNIDLTNLSASNLTSGTIADARIPASAVSQHATSFDDNAIVNDLSTLALRSATSENAIAYSTSNQFIDVFQDDTGISSNTNAPRNSSEYVSTFINASWSTDSSNLMTGLSNVFDFDNSLTASYGSLNLVAQGSPSFSGTKKLGTHSTYNDSDNNGYSFTGGVGHLGFSADESVSMSCWVRRNHDTNTWNMLYDGYRDGYGNDSHSNLIFGIDASDRPSMMDFSSGNWHYATSTVDQNAWIHLAFSYSTTKKLIFQNGTKYLDQTLSDGSSGASTTYHRLLHRHNNQLSFRGYVDQMCFWKGRAIGQTEATNLYNGGAGNVFTGGVASATGNFISNTITAPSSKSKIGAIITYEDTSGTNALNTDIILQLSADNGSNFTTATLTALPNFATGIKMAKVNDLSVTAGTQLKYKISFANQSSGSKEARIRGVSLQY